MDSEMQKYITMLVFAALLITLVRFSIPFKIKRVIRKSEFVQKNLNNRNVRKFIAFLRMNTLINVPQIGQTLRETQLIINKAEHIDGKLKLALYNILMRKRIAGLQTINPVYLDKNGNRT